MPTLASHYNPDDDPLLLRLGLLPRPMALYPIVRTGHLAGEAWRYWQYEVNPKEGGVKGHGAVTAERLPPDGPDALEVGVVLTAYVWHIHRNTGMRSAVTDGDDLVAVDRVVACEPRSRYFCFFVGVLRTHPPPFSVGGRRSSFEMATSVPPRLVGR